MFFSSSSFCLLFLKLSFSAWVSLAAFSYWRPYVKESIGSFRFLSRTGLYCTLHWGQIWLTGSYSVFSISSTNLTTLWAIISVTSSLKPKYEWLRCRNSCESRGERDLKSSYANIDFQVLVRVCWKPFNQSTDLLSSLLTTKVQIPTDLAKSNPHFQSRRWGWVFASV